MRYRVDFPVRVENMAEFGTEKKKITLINLLAIKEIKQSDLEIKKNWKFQNGR